ncbi:hypothetical protein [Bifidobacterium sp. SO1]|uniref:hypothetical protein n=1 Tax=Bifidobacterium sp. SO1 TaxID=2809029 RepID=UPI001BDD08AD|nr:hypothetical protein [Bifidobacterium sp. SO1]MBT1162822.1 hypothetical protein [Bifidobacterium sp. SO1]
MNSEERFWHEYLDRFHYTDRTDDGYGPDSPRVGDKGSAVTYSVTESMKNIPFTIEIEPTTGLPALHANTGEWMGLFDFAVSPWRELYLHERAHGTAVIHGNGVDECADLTPPYEGVETVMWKHGRLYTADGGQPVGGDDAIDLMDALIRLGYETIERKNRV